MLTDNRIRIFLTVAEELSFTGAAERLGMSQPSVSQSVDELEQRLGVKLFERHRRGVVITDAGETFRVYARRIMDSYESASVIFSEYDPVEIRICASDELYESSVIPIIARLSGIHPHITIRRTPPQEADLTLELVRDGSVYNVGFRPAEEFSGTAYYRLLVETFSTF